MWVLLELLPKKWIEHEILTLIVLTMLAREVHDDAGSTFCFLVELVSAYLSLLESSYCCEVLDDGPSCITDSIVQAQEASLNGLRQASCVMYCLVQGDKSVHFSSNANKDSTNMWRVPLSSMLPSIVTCEMDICKQSCLILSIIVWLFTEPILRPTCSLWSRRSSQIYLQICPPYTYTDHSDFITKQRCNFSPIWFIVDVRVASIGAAASSSKSTSSSSSSSLRIHHTFQELESR